MNSYKSIRINGAEYEPDNLDRLLEQFNTANDLEWIEPIHQFLSDWFADTDFIEVSTSGSTGNPKKIGIRKVSMIESAKATSVFLGLKPSDNALLCLPANYIAGKMMLVRAMVSGFSLHVIKPTANPFFNVNETIDFAALSPYQLSHSTEILKKRFVRKIIVGGAPVSPKLETLVQDLPVDIYETFGMTETISHIALRKINGEDRSSYFQVLPGIEIKVDERQCLVIKAPTLFSGELVTNDIIELQGSIGFKWLGRLDNVINSGGIKLFPEIIERKLEGVINANFLISSKPDADFGEKVVLVIEGFEPDSGVQEKLNIQLKSHLEKFEIPKEILYIPLFPIKLSGKMNRKGFIRDLFENKTDTK